ncbi:hypothetical protein RYX36_017966 [Vicia faba]
MQSPLCRSMKGGSRRKVTVIKVEVSERRMKFSNGFFRMNPLGFDIRIGFRLKLKGNDAGSRIGVPKCFPTSYLDSSFHYSMLFGKSDFLAWKNSYSGW